MQINKFRLAVVILILVAAGFFIYSFQSKITANAIKIQEEQKFLNDWLPENCKCLEKNLTKCSDDFELISGFCKNEKLGTFTNVLKACSKYDCEAEGTNYIFNQENKKWEIVKN